MVLACTAHECYYFLMAKRPSKKVGGARNDARKNGKAAKKTPGTRPSFEPVSELQKVLNGGGLYAKWNDVRTGKVKGLPERKLEKARTDAHPNSSK